LPYMSQFYIALILLVFSLLPAITTVAEMPNETALTVVGEEYAPFSYISNGTVSGQAVDLIENLSAEIGLPVRRADMTLLPWDDAYNATKNGKNTLLLAVYRTPERESDLQWVGPYADDSSAFFVSSASNIKITTPEDLKDLKVGVVSGDAHYRMLIGYSIPETNIAITDNLSTLVQLVENNSIDALFSGEQAGKWVIKESGRNQNLLPVALRVNEQQVWFGLSPETPKATVTALQAALAQRGIKPSSKTQYNQDVS
jgi:polar amino acid transport system substrate-binding protein